MDLNRGFRRLLSCPVTFGAGHQRQDGNACSRRNGSPNRLGWARPRAQRSDPVPALIYEMPGRAFSMAIGRFGRLGVSQLNGIPVKGAEQENFKEFDHEASSGGRFPPGARRLQRRPANPCRLFRPAHTLRARRIGPRIAWLPIALSHEATLPVAGRAWFWSPDLRDHEPQPGPVWSMPLR